MRSDIDIEGKLAGELVGTILQVAGTNVLSVTEERAALVFTSGVAGIHRLGLTILVVVGLTAQNAIAIHLLRALVLDDRLALGLTVRALIAAAAAIAAHVTVMAAALLAFAVIAMKVIVGDGIRSALIRTLTHAHLARALGADGFALFGAGFAARLLTARDIRFRAALAARLIGLLRTDLLHGGGRAGRLALLNWLEFTVGVHAQVHAATFIERLRVRRPWHQQDTRQQCKRRQRGRDSNTHGKTPWNGLDRGQFAD
jgi:hypothetical protein